MGSPHAVQCFNELIGNIYDGSHRVISYIVISHMQAFLSAELLMKNTSPSMPVALLLLNVFLFEAQSFRRMQHEHFHAGIAGHL